MDLLDIFYNYIVKEASIGKVKCCLTFSILFNTIFLEDNKDVINNESEHLIPTLTIHNKKLFDELLCKYVDLCSYFYSTSNFEKEILDCVDYDKDRTCPEKYIMTLLWVNATYDDFLHPEEYLQRRINFLENSKEETFETDYIEDLNGKINFAIKKDVILFETPFKIELSLVNNDGEQYTFPEIKFGIDNDTVYFYVIQNFTTTNNNNNNYAKKINRLLFKIGEGFDATKDNYELFSEGNLKDVTASFVVAINMAITYFHSLGYRNIKVASILPVRWNSKNLIIERKQIMGRYSLDEKSNKEERLEEIQKNLTEKFIRTFLRLAYHYEGINIESLPMELDSYLHLNLEDNIYTSNKLLQDTTIGNGIKHHM